MDYEEKCIFDKDETCWYQKEKKKYMVHNQFGSLFERYVMELLFCIGCSIKNKDTNKTRNTVSP